MRASGNATCKVRYLVRLGQAMSLILFRSPPHRFQRIGQAARMPALGIRVAFAAPQQIIVASQHAPI
jgi:hypothetical protein